MATRRPYNSFEMAQAQFDDPEVIQGFVQRNDSNKFLKSTFG